MWAGAGTARRLLLLRTTSGYKFPGGGVEADEDFTAALARELDEECGADLLHTGGEILTVIERRAQGLERYERHLGLRPEWVGLTDAIDVTGRAVAAGGAPRWAARELTVLSHLRDTDAC